MGLNYELDCLLWKLVHNFVRDSKISEHLNNTREDLLSEARIAATYALRSYDAKKKTKLTTYICACVLNRFRDLHDYEKSKPKIDYVLDLPEYDSTDMAEIELDMTMRTVLDKTEYMVFRKNLVEGFSLRDIAKQSSLSQRKVKQCYENIVMKYAKLEDLQDQLMARRRMQEQWVHDV